MSHPYPKRNFVPKGVLMKSSLKTLNTARQNSSRAAVSVNTARSINTAYTRPIVNCARPALNVFNRAYSHVRRPFNKFTTNKNSKFNEKVNTVKGNVTIVGPKAVVSDNKGNEAKCCLRFKLSGELVPGKDYILLPLLTQDSPFSSSSKDSLDARFKPSGEEENKDAKVLKKEKKDENVNSINNINTVSSTVNSASINDNAVDENIVYGCEDDPNMPNLENIIYSDDDEDVGAEADMTNLETLSFVCHIDSSTEFTRVGIILLKDFRDYTFSTSNQKDDKALKPKKVIQALTDPSWIEAMQDELLVQLQQVRHWWNLHMARGPLNKMDLQKTRKAERGFVVRNTAAYASFKDFVVYQMDVKSAFLYGKIEEEVYVCHPPRTASATERCDGDFIRQGQESKQEVQFLGSRLISWQCKKQTIVANSTTKAEYVAASSCCGQVLWIQNQMLDYGYNFMNTKIFVDNESTIRIIKNPVFHSKTKHIEIKHHFIRDSYKKRLIQVIKIHTDHNVADLLTKAFDVSRFRFLTASIGMLNL
ncbi:putative ribonuclease H-like domain-containing protein [Tanacetum coccineum]